MSERRKKRSKREMLADMLEALDEGEMNKNQISRATGIGGQHLNTLVDKYITNGLLEWTGEITRPQSVISENYGQNLKSTERGRAWLKLWRLILRVEDPTSKIRVTIQNREKSKTS